MSHTRWLPLSIFFLLGALAIAQETEKKPADPLASAA
jgi:hypothetical protein